MTARSAGVTRGSTETVDGAVASSARLPQEIGFQRHVDDVAHEGAGAELPEVDFERRLARHP